MGFIADIFTADRAADAQKDASRDQIAASERATAQTVGLQRDIFNRIWNGTQVQRDAGDAATRMMAQIMGLQLPAQASQPNTGQQPGSQAQVPSQQGGNALRNGPFGGNVVANGLAAVASLNGGKDGSGAMFMRGNELPGPTVIGENGQTYGGMQGGNALGGGSSMPGQPQAPGNALNPANPQTTPQANPAQPFDATAWLRSTPGYEANFKEGARAANHMLASGGKLFSGDAGREMTRYGQQYADRIYGDQFNRLASIAGAGQTATSQGGQAGQNYANQSGQAYQQNALNLGSSYQNRGNAISGFWGNVNGSINNTANAFGQMFMGGF